MKDSTRHIEYIEPDEDLLQKQVEWAIKVSMEERLKVFCKHLRVNYALAGIDVTYYPVERTIYYIEDGTEPE
jgi:hypothetical protein